MRALAIAVVVMVALPARADRTKAEQYFRAGAQAFKQQSFAAAAQNFELAFAQLPLPEIAFSAAQAYRREYFIDPKPEYVKRAVELYRIYLDKVKTGGRVGDASDGLAEMQRELERLTASGAKIASVVQTATRLAVSVTVAGEQKTALTSELSAIPATDTTGAKATLDGKPVELFVPVEVAPGEHTIEVTAPGYFPITVKRRAVEGASDVVEAELKPEPAHLAITAEDGAAIAINGRPAGTAPLPPQELPAGTYTVTITRRGRDPVVREVVLGRAETAKLEVALVRTSKRRALPWVIGGAGVLAIGAGLATGVAISADNGMSSLEHERVTTGITAAQLQTYDSDVSRRDGARDAAYVLGGAAIATAATAALLYYFDVPQPSERLIVPTASPSGAGVAVIGRF